MKEAQLRNIYDQRDGELLILSLRIGSAMKVAELTEKILEAFLDVDTDTLYGIKPMEAHQFRVWSGGRELRHNEPVPDPPADLSLVILENNQDRINGLGTHCGTQPEVQTLQLVLAMLEKYTDPHVVSEGLDGIEAVVQALRPATTQGTDHQDLPPTTREADHQDQEASELLPALMPPANLDRGGPGLLLGSESGLLKKLQQLLHVQKDTSASTPDLRALLLEALDVEQKKRGDRCLMLGEVELAQHLEEDAASGEAQSSAVDEQQRGPKWWRRLPRQKEAEESKPQSQQQTRQRLQPPILTAVLRPSDLLKVVQFKSCGVYFVIPHETFTDITLEGFPFSADVPLPQPQLPPHLIACSKVFRLGPHVPFRRRICLSIPWAPPTAACRPHFYKRSGGAAEWAQVPDDQVTLLPDSVRVYLTHLCYGVMASNACERPELPTMCKVKLWMFLNPDEYIGKLYISSPDVEMNSKMRALDHEGYTFSEEKVCEIPRSCTLHICRPSTSELVKVTFREAGLERNGLCSKRIHFESRRVSWSVKYVLNGQETPVWDAVKITLPSPKVPATNFPVRSLAIAPLTPTDGEPIEFAELQKLRAMGLRIVNADYVRDVERDINSTKPRFLLMIAHGEEDAIALNEEQLLGEEFQRCLEENYRQTGSNPECILLAVCLGEPIAMRLIECPGVDFVTFWEERIAGGIANEHVMNFVEGIPKEEKRELKHPWYIQAFRASKPMIKGFCRAHKLEDSMYLRCAFSIWLEEEHKGDELIVTGRLGLGGKKVCRVVWPTSGSRSSLLEALREDLGEECGDLMEPEGEGCHPFFKQSEIVLRLAQDSQIGASTETATAGAASSSSPAASSASPHME